MEEEDSGRASLEVNINSAVLSNQLETITEEVNMSGSNIAGGNLAGGSIASGHSVESKITTLGEDNYLTWKWQIEFILNEKGLLEVVKNTTPEGYQPTKKDLQASSILASSLSQLNMQRVINCKTANQIWTALEASFENKSMTERTMLMDQFTSYKIKSIKDVSIEIGMIQSLANRLKTLGASIDDQMIISILLKALPESLKTWKATWKMVNAEKPSLNNLITGVMAEISEMKSPSDTALLATGSQPSWKGNMRDVKRVYNPSSGGNRQLRSKTSCYYCDKPGHWIRECKKKQFDDKKASEQKNRGIAMMAVAPRSLQTKGMWIADSGCSTHMTPNKEWIKEYEAFSTEKPITLGDGKSIPAKGSGKIITSFGTMGNVHFVPDLSANLFSISAAAENGIVSKYYRDKIQLFKEESLVLEGSKIDGVYMLKFGIIQNMGKALAAVSLETWHKRLAHAPKEVILKMAREKIVENLDLKKAESNDIECIDCVMGKCKHTTHSNRSTDKVLKPGASLHFDTVGPFREESLGGSKYLLLCKDEASSYKFGIPVSTKSEIVKHVKKTISIAELQSKTKALCISTDNGSEFINKELEAFLNERGINHKTSVPYVPQQNGFIEREVRTVIETARTLLNHSGLPKYLWAEATNTTIYVQNRTPNTRTGNKTPYEIWFNHKPSVKNLHIFGQDAIVMFRDYERGKWDKKGMLYKFIGYTDIFNTFRFFDPDHEQVFISCDATFIDNVETSDSQVIEKNNEIILDSIIDQTDFEQVNDEELETSTNNDLSWYHECDLPTGETEDQNSGTENAEVNETMDKPADSFESSIAPIKVVKIPRERPRPYVPVKGHRRRKSIGRMGILKDLHLAMVPERRYARRDHIKNPTDSERPSDIHPSHVVPSRLRSGTKDKLHAKLATIEAEEDPQTFKEAMSRKDKDKWIEAMNEELRSLQNNHVFQLVERPKTNVVTNKWVYKIKRDPLGNIERYKARLVARGFSQIYGVDYLETYAPVANMTSIRMLFAYAAAENLEIAQFDIKTAFLYGELNETVFMEQPEGYVRDNSKVYLLKRSLYGLKQSPRQWNQKFKDFLKELKLNVSEHDECVFFRTEPVLIIAIYVDDGIIMAKDKPLIEQTMKQLKGRFEVHSCDLSTFLGFQIDKSTKNEIRLHQTSYLRTILKRYNMEDAKPTDSPIAMLPSQQTVEEQPLNEEVPYREAVGSLMYAAVITRLDITNAVTKVAQKVSNPTMQDWVAVKRIFRYLKGKEGLSIKYGGTDDKKLTVYCDADFAGDASTSRSTTGSVFIYGGGPILWKSQRQKLITLSSTEAEFVSLCSATKETIWLRKLAKELNLIDHNPTTILCDNQSTIKIACNEKSIHRTRHMSVHAKYPREQIEAGEIKIEHIKPGEQLADMLTKPTTIKRFIENRSRLMSTVLVILHILVILIKAYHCTNAYYFNRVSPLVFEPIMNVFVETGTSLYDLEVTFSSPCDTIPTNQTHKYAQSQFTMDDYNMYKTIYVDCTAMFEQHWVSRIQELVQSTYEIQEAPKTLITVRAKRNPFLLLWIGMPIAVTIITNLLTTLSSYYVPYGDSKRMDRIIDWMQDQQAIDKARLEILAQRFNQSDEIQKGMLETLSSVTKVVYQNKERIEHLTDRMPHVMWEGAYLQNVIQEAGGKLQYITDLYQKTGQAATKHMASLWNLTDIKAIDSEDTKIEGIMRLSNATIIIKMAVRNKSPDTRAFQITPFNYWTNITDDPYISKYVGSLYMIYNTSNNCMKAIDEPKGVRTIIEECKIKNWKDPKLIHFIRMPKEEEEIHSKPTSKRIGLYNYIYCYKYNITIDEETLECPAHVFKLPLTSSFSMLGRNYTPRVIHSNSNGPVWKIIDTNLPGALMPEQNADELNLYKSIENLKRVQSNAQMRASEVIMITKYSNTWWAFNIFILAIFIIMGIVLLKRYRRLCAVRRLPRRHVSYSDDINSEENTLNEDPYANVTTSHKDNSQ